MATDRKQKIETLQKIVAGVDPRPPRIHVLLNKMSAYELNALIALKRMPLEEAKKMLEERGVYTTEEIIAFLNTDEFKAIMTSKGGDKFIVFVDAEGCEPLQDEPEPLQEINADATDEPVNEVEPIEATEQDEPVITEEINSQPVFVPVVKKDNREKETRTFNLLGEEIKRDKQRAEKMNAFMKQYNSLN